LTIAGRLLRYVCSHPLLDFGIAQAHGDRPPPPGFRGRLSYLAPELIRGERVDARADVFALGAMLWEAISVVPFNGGPSVDDRTKLRMRLEGGEANIRQVKPGTPEALATIIDRAIALDPAQRFADAESFASALEEYLQGVRPQPSAQSLSSLVGPMFELERSRQRVVVEPQLQLAHRWDREHESALEQEPQLEGAVQSPSDAAPASSLVPFVPHVQYPLTQGAFSYDPSYASAADTVSPEARSRLRLKTVAVLAVAALVGIVGGALLGRDDAPPERAARHRASSAPARQCARRAARAAAQGSSRRGACAQRSHRECDAQLA
jgi:eukaryotic-like serine/threonine-protein kinase